jgi:putative serine protease PepD
MPPQGPPQVPPQTFQQVPPGDLAPPPQAPARRKGVAVLAAVALAAGLAGGAAGAAIDRAAGGGTSVVSSLAGTVNGAPAANSATGLSAVASAALPSVVQVNESAGNLQGTGSGVIISSDGQILTNNHVIADAANGQGTITVVFNDGKTADATVVGADPNSDLAVIKAQNVSGLHPAALGDSSSVQVGQQVMAIGSPEGLQGTVTSGIVSALNRKVTVDSSGGGSGGSGGYGRRHPFGGTSSQSVTYNAIQTDAPINPGNSGGPLLNTAGQVIGINSAIYAPVSVPGSQGGSIGLGFAIPINQAKTIAQQLVSKGSVGG